MADKPEMTTYEVLELMSSSEGKEFARAYYAQRDKKLDKNVDEDVKESEEAWKDYSLRLGDEGKAMVSFIYDKIVDIKGGWYGKKHLEAADIKSLNRLFKKEKEKVAGDVEKVRRLDDILYNILSEREVSGYRIRGNYDTDTEANYERQKILVNNPNAKAYDLLRYIEFEKDPVVVFRVAKDLDKLVEAVVEEEHAKSVMDEKRLKEVISFPEMLGWWVADHYDNKTSIEERKERTEKDFPELCGLVKVLKKKYEPGKVMDLSNEDYIPKFNNDILEENLKLKAEVAALTEQLAVAVEKETKLTARQDELVQGRQKMIQDMLELSGKNEELLKENSKLKSEVSNVNNNLGTIKSRYDDASKALAQIAGKKLGDKIAKEYVKNNVYG